MKLFIASRSSIRFIGLISLIVAAGAVFVPTPAAAREKVGDYVSGAAPSGPGVAIPPGQYGQIADRAFEVLNGSLKPTILASDVANDLASYYVVDVRGYEDWCDGHIPGAVNMPWPTEIVEPDNLEMLPTDTPIVVVCYTGHTASQTTMLFNLLGYNASALKNGFISWDYPTDPETYPVEECGAEAAPF